MDATSNKSRVTHILCIHRSPIAIDWGMQTSPMGIGKQQKRKQQCIIMYRVLQLSLNVHLISAPSHRIAGGYQTTPRLDHTL